MKLAIVFLALSLPAFAQQSPTPPLPVVQMGTPKPPSPEDAKALQDLVDARNLDEIDLQTAQQSVVQNDPLAKRANATLTRIVTSDPDVKKAREQLNADQKTLQDKVAAMRKAQEPPLDETWDLDLEHNRWVQPQGPKLPKPATPAASAKK